MRSLNLSQALYRDSPSGWVKEVISVLRLAVLPGGKYLLRKAFERASQVVNNLGSSFCSQSLALSLSRNGKSLSRIALVVTPLSLMVSHFTRNLRRYTLGLSKGWPSSWSRSTKVISAGLSSKLLG